MLVSDLQFIGTHNSYHIQPDAAVFRKMVETGYRESARWDAKALEQALSFTHPPLTQQLDMGLRVFELDVHDDPEGGRFANPGFLKALGEEAANLEPVDPKGELLKPGLKVFHTPDTDVRSQCLRFALCLEEIARWSRSNPGHMPIFVQIETKEGNRPAIANAYEPAEKAPFTADSWARLHDEILAAFSRDQLFLPADLQGRYGSVNEAVRKQGWPSAASMAGKIVFLLLDDPKPSDAYARLIDGGMEPVLFLSRDEKDPHTAWILQAKPKRRIIRPLVEAGFLVYTRADANSGEAGRSDYARASQALDSGAQLISTDHPVAREEGGYAVGFGGAFVRCNPATRPDGCVFEVQPAGK